MNAEKAVKILKANDERRIASIYESIKDLAIKALEKQIPKKPVINNYFLCGKHTIKVAFCPTCDVSLGLYNYATDFKCCHNCGQALDWSDV